VLFETPIAHFLVRAFLAEGVDEFLAHITTIEAALGLRADYQKSFRLAPDRRKGMRATNRMRDRVAGLHAIAATPTNMSSCSMCEAPSCTAAR
jgi:hypothetical protein